MKTILITLLCSLTAWAQIDVQPRVLLNWPMTDINVSTLLPAADAASGCNWVTGTKTGGAACINDIAFVNACLTGASEPVGGPPNWPCPTGGATITKCLHLHFDISIGAGSDLTVPAASCVKLTGVSQGSSGGASSNAGGTGIFILNGSNSSAICTLYTGVISGCPDNVDGITPTPAQSGALVVRDLGIQMNRATQGHNSTSGDLRCQTYWCMGILAVNLEYLEISGVTVQDPTAYTALTSNIGNQVYEKIQTISSVANHAPNTDGIHIDGPCYTGSIDDSYFMQYDDAIAFNLIEGYGGSCTGPWTISNIRYQNSLSAFRAYVCDGGTHYSLGPVTLTNLTGSLTDPNGLGVNGFQLGNPSFGACTTDELQSIQATNVNLNLLNGGNMINVSNNIGNLIVNNVIWSGPTAAGAFLNFAAAATISNYQCSGSSIYQNSSGSSAAYWLKTVSGASIRRMEYNGCAITVEQGVSATTVSYGHDIVAGSTVGTFNLGSLDPANTTTLLNGNEWSRITNFYGAGVPNYFRDILFANLPPATYIGLSASISDSAAVGIWGATETGGSPGHYAQLNSNGANWTVTGK
jgi:hypothetical protein